MSMRSLSVALLTAAATHLPAQQAIVSGPIAARGDSALTAAAKDGFSGVALVAKNGDVLLTKGYGMANRAAGTPMRANTIVQVGSNTKDFTTVAILQLMDGGKLSLSDSISKWFGNVPADKRGITVEHLLRHRAGFEQHLGPDFDAVTREEEIARAMAAPLAFPPGSDRKYSNIGYSLLAAIIELTTGTSYDLYVHEHIMKPLGLKETGWRLPGFDAVRVARGYREGEDRGSFLERPTAPDGPYWNLRGNGGMLSTVTDMHRFYQALFSANAGGLVTPASRDLFFVPDRPLVLAGSDLTHFFYYSRNPASGFAVILASNSTDYPARKAREALEGAIGARPSTAGRPVMDVASDTTARLAPAFPDTPAGRAARKLMRVHGDVDAAELRRFLAEDVVPRAGDRRTLDERVAGFQQMRGDIGALTLTRVVSQTPTSLVFTARTAKEARMTYTITVEAQAPFRITSIAVEAE
jgi:CubicO group peptidase (beta-lactamase class C family)